ncbi:SURF1 family protein [Nocardioides sp. YIM 152315]|uniref:SURF1 family cytochrome oxidase biogenesis protein n=1 Tax=Nocardioides sp. YIM 152315 TaxID=3031760 RepID=UPI0031F37CCA
MRSWRFLLSRRWLTFGAIVVLLCYAAWWLGQWQFHRLEERKESNAVVRANEDRAPSPVGDVLAPGRPVTEDDEWRQVTATGKYDVDDTIIVRYRTRDGQSGIDVVVPLVTGDGATLLVDRGWMATDNQGAEPDDVPTPPGGEVTVEGWARADGTGESTAVSGRSTRAISSERIGAAIGAEVYGGFVVLESEDGEPAAGLEPVELPELNNGPHFFYGLQWWFFGLLAVVGFGYLAWDERRTRRSGDADDSPEQEGGERKRRRAARNARKQQVKAAYQRAYDDERAARAAHRARTMPPSTGSIEPETNDAAGDSTKAATRSNSSGSP